jgi:hypothetical protein
VSHQIYCIVKNSQHFDHMILGRSVHDEMSPTASAACNMKGSKVGADVFARDTSQNVRTIFERGERFKKCDSIDVDLSFPERIFCAFQDAGEIPLSLGAETNSPSS